MRKLLFIITKSEMGGAQRFLYEFVTHLNIEKYDITIAAGGNGELFEKLAGKNIKIVKVKNFSNFFSIKNFLALIEIFNLIWKIHPNVIYLLSSEAGFIGSLAGSFYRLLFWQKNLKIIYRIGGWGFKEPENTIIKKMYLWAEKISAPFKNIIIVNSEFDRQLAIKNQIVKSEKIITIYNGLDFHRLKFLPRDTARKFLFRSNSPMPSILIGTIANLYKNKGLEYLILAAKKLQENKKDFNLMIIGDGPERQSLEKIIKKYELENTVSLIGTIPNAYQFLKAFDLFVLPSVKEGQPWVILEAMAAEIPIVATDIAGIPEMLENEKSGLLVEPTDFKALTVAIEKILNHPSLAHEMAQNAFTIVKEKFGIEEMMRKNEEFFLEP